MKLRFQTRIFVDYLARGFALGSGAILAIQAESVWRPLSVLGLAISGLLLVLAFSWFRQPKSVGKRPSFLARLILVVFDYPAAVQFGVLLGWSSVFFLVDPSLRLSLTCVLGGLLVGVALYGWQLARLRWVRRAVGVGLLLGAAGIVWQFFPSVVDAMTAGRLALAVSFVATAIVYYIILLAGSADETEFDAALICLFLALALAQIRLGMLLQRLVILAPMALFVAYAERMRKRLLVFKQVLRGMANEQQGKYREALIWYRLALRNDSRSDLANAGNWRVHRKIDLSLLESDPDLAEMIDPAACLGRVRSILDRAEKSPPPTNLALLDEARRLVELVAKKRGDAPLTLGWEELRIALLREDAAAPAFALGSKLVEVRPTQIGALPDQEADALFRIWSALLKEPRLAADGVELLHQTDRRFAFLAALERRLRSTPDDGVALSFKAITYERVSLADYESYLEQTDDNLAWFDHGLARQQGIRLADEGRISDAMEQLRIAELGLPTQRLSIWAEMAKIADKAGIDSAGYRQRIKDFALEIGLAKLAPDQRDVFFDTVRNLAERARAAGDLPSAIDNYQWYVESPKSGIATQTLLLELLKKSDAFEQALKPIETALTYSLGESERRTWLAEKEDVYKKIRVDKVTANWKTIGRFLDTGYCLRRAKILIDQRADPGDIVPLIDLACLGGSQEILKANQLLGRLHYQQGAIDDAIRCLQQVCASKPERFTDDESKEAYFQANRLLGEIFLQDRPDPEKAIDSLLVYKDHLKSGADTLYKLGLAHERAGRNSKARYWYDMVLVYPSHPRAEEAKQALERLKKT